jgi:uncharacterized protein
LVFKNSISIKYCPHWYWRLITRQGINYANNRFKQLLLAKKYVFDKYGNIHFRQMYIKNTTFGGSKKFKIRQKWVKNSTFGGSKKIKYSKMGYLEEFNIVGRVEEINTFGILLNSQKAELVVVYGRRRVGKTFLIRSFFKDIMCFEFSGTINTAAEKQLYNFAQTLGKYSGKKNTPVTPVHWQEAFVLLTQYLEKIRNKKKKVIFFDELPWLDTMHSGFLAAFDYWWNSWCTKRNDIIVVICGSAANWMINKIINNKGGLHNRVTKEIKLLPFTLAETQEFFTVKKTKLDQYQIAQIYMAMGGVPFYLDAVEPGKSAMQNIDSICFAKKGLLHTEFDKLYAALYSNASIHINIIRVLARKQIGLLRSEIVQQAKLKSGGYLTEILTELEESGFINSYIPLNKKLKDRIYRLTDEYSLFYLKFIEHAKSFKAGTWATICNSQSYISWSGYAFENLCLKHTQNIKKSLGIGALYSEQSAWYNKKEKAQIDLVIQRADRCINLCEMKFSGTPYELTTKYAKELQHKVMAYKLATNTRSTLFTTLVTTFGLKQNEHSTNHIDNIVLLKDLFV